MTIRVSVWWRLLRGGIKKFTGLSARERLAREALYGEPNPAVSRTNLDGIFPQLVRFGYDCIISPTAMILTHDASTWLHTGKYRVAPVTIGNRVFIGYGAIILPGVHIGDDAIVGAGAVVTKDIPSRSVAVGVPAKVVYSIDEFVDRHQNDLLAPPPGWTRFPTTKDLIAFQELAKKAFQLDR